MSFEMPHVSYCQPLFLLKPAPPIPVKITSQIQRIPSLNYPKLKSIAKYYSWPGSSVSRGSGDVGVGFIRPWSFHLGQCKLLNPGWFCRHEKVKPQSHLTSTTQNSELLCYGKGEFNN